MLLHIINKSPYTHVTLKTCGQFCARRDAILLLEDGVYAISHPDVRDLVLKEIRVYAIEADVVARGLTARLPDKVQIVGYEAFVALCVEYPKTQTW